jgi:hypothetical protein
MIKLFKNVYRDRLVLKNQGPAALNFTGTVQSGTTTLQPGGTNTNTQATIAAAQTIANQLFQQYVQSLQGAQNGRSLIRFNPATDVLENQGRTVSSVIWSTGNANLSTFFTSSTQSSTAKSYYYAVYNDTPTVSGSLVQFGVAYGNKYGSGSLSSEYTPTQAVYSQFRLLLLGGADSTFTFNSGSSTENSDDIYVISLNRARLKDTLDPGNWQLNLATLSGSAVANSVHTGSNVKVKGDNTFVSLVDDSSITNTATLTDAGVRYNIVSGSILNGTTTLYTTGSNYVYYGHVYPKLGIVVLNGKTLNSNLAFNTVSGSNIAGDNAFKLFTAISGAAAINSTYGFTARNSQKVISSNYFVRVKNGDLNYSNNPTFVSGTLGDLYHSEFVSDPQVYITSVGLYNDKNELLAIAKISRPILKNFDEEVLLRVRLDY